MCAINHMLDILASFSLVLIWSLWNESREADGERNRRFDAVCSFDAATNGLLESIFSPATSIKLESNLEINIEIICLSDEHHSRVGQSQHTKVE
jgi:hypothetical protein